MPIEHMRQRSARVSCAKDRVAALGKGSHIFAMPVEVIASEAGTEARKSAGGGGFDPVVVVRRSSARRGRKNRCRGLHGGLIGRNRAGK